MKNSLLTYIMLFISAITFGADYDSIVDSTIVRKRSDLTQKLYDTLLAIKGNGIFFGMQHATGYGVGWNNDNNRSDIKSVTGDYPAFGGWGVSFKHNNIAKGEGFEAAC
jgi:mannan endo-1,4-beta-mannosidase